MRTGPKSNYHLEENNKYILKSTHQVTEHTAQSYNRITKHNKSKTYPHSTSKEKTKETQQAYASTLLDVEYLGNDVWRNIFGEKDLNRKIFLTAVKNITI